MKSYESHLCPIKIAGQSRKINDLLCCLIRTSTVERLTLCLAPCIEYKLSCPASHSYISAVNINIHFICKGKLTRSLRLHDYAAFLCYYTVSVYMHVRTLGWPLCFSSVHAFHNIAPANLSGVLKPEWLVCSLNVGELRVRGERKDIKPTRGKINMRQGSGTDSIL